MPCVHGLREGNPIEIALAEQSAAVLRQKGVSLKHQKDSEGHTNPPESTRRGQIVNSTKLGQSLEATERSSVMPPIFQVVMIPPGLGEGSGE